MSSDSPRFRQLAEPAENEQGGRVELRLETSIEGKEAVYVARFFVGTKQFAGAFRLSLAPLEVEARAIDEGLPRWLLEFTTTLLRTTGRSATKVGFPRRLTRWRKGDGESDARS